MKKANVTINNLLGRDQKLTFLIGAGCSVDSPSCQPAGRSMMEAMIKFTCAESEIGKILNIRGLRYEALIEIIRDILDQKLNIIDYYGLCDKPNVQHFFIAEKLIEMHIAKPTIKPTFSSIPRTRA